MGDLKSVSIKDLLFLQEKMSKAFDEAIDRYGTDGLSGGVWSPVVDIYERDSDFLVKAEIPGVDLDTISVEVLNGTLTFKGDRVVKKVEDDAYRHRMECYHGTFQRSFTLGKEIDVDNIKASFTDGVLEIVIPKSKVDGAKKIKVKSK